MPRTRSTFEELIPKRWIEGGAKDTRSAHAAKLIAAMTPVVPPMTARLQQDFERSVAARAVLKSSKRFLHVGWPAASAIAAVAAGIVWLRVAGAPPMRYRAPLEPSTAPAPRSDAKRAIESGPVAPTVPVSATPPAPAASHHRSHRASVRGPSDDGTLDEQVTLIGAALHVLREAHDPDAALALIGEFDRRFPSGELAQEAHAVLFEARAARKVQEDDDTSVGRGDK
jgi:hypothetical protein